MVGSKVKKPETCDTGLKKNSESQKQASKTFWLKENTQKTLSIFHSQDDFSLRKKNILAKKDKSIRGGVDEHIKSLVSSINDHTDYYTTSSCSGRIVLSVGEIGKKSEHTWVYVTHNPTFAITDLRTAMAEFAKKQSTNENSKTLYMMVESFILHIACRNSKALGAIAQFFSKNGLQKHGLLSSRTGLFEVRGAFHLCMPIIVNNVPLLNETEESVMALCQFANEKLEKNLSQLALITKDFNESLFR